MLIEFSIFSARLKLPSTMSKNAHSLLSGLLRRTPENRLGYGADGDEQVKKHVFFKGMNWSKLYRREVRPPFIPHVDLNMTNNFDTKYTEQIPTGKFLSLKSYCDQYQFYFRLDCQASIFTHFVQGIQF